MKSAILVGASAHLFLCMAIASAQDNCPAFTPGLFNSQVADSSVLALHSFDDGTGPALFVGGAFRRFGSQEASRVVKWDGAAPSALGGGLNDTVYALADFDDGSGRALFVGGLFTQAGGIAANRIAKWDGSVWSPLGEGLSGTVRALAVFDDGTGSALYAAGDFSAAGGQAANRVARWNGSAWSPVGTGLLGGFVNALAVFNDGTGPALYAGGTFQTAEGVSSPRLARWNGTRWSALASTVNDDVRALAVVNDGSGAALYVGGDFTQIVGGLTANHIARWSGGLLSAVRSGVNGNVYAIAPLPLSGGGTRLAIGGTFTSAGMATTRRIAILESDRFVELGAGFDAQVAALGVFDPGSGPALVAGGAFTTSGGVGLGRIARFVEGSGWQSFGDDGPTAAVTALESFNLGGGSALFVGGQFVAVGPIAASHVAQWDGRSFSPLGAGFDAAARAFALFDDGSGPALYAGGSFTASGATTVDAVARWDGSAWGPVAGGLPGGEVDALLVFDDGSGLALYAGGEIPLGGGATRGIVRYDGLAWSPVGADVPGRVSALAIHDDGNGPALFAGGSFESAGGAPASRLARWDGVSWTALGPGVDGAVLSLASHDDGTGPSLFAGGQFRNAGGLLVNRVTRWDGAAFHSLKAGIGGAISSLAVYDDGTGRSLYLGGSASNPSSTQRDNMYRWNGTDFIVLSTGVNGPVNALATFADGDGVALYAGGSFTYAGGVSSHNLARWIDACAVPRTGTVDAAEGVPSDVLFVNDSAGGAARTVMIGQYVPLTVFLNSPPRAGGRAPFSLYAVAGDLDGSDRRRMPFGIGTVAFPTPLHGGSPAIRAIWNNTGKSALGIPRRASTPAPSVIVSVPSGAGRPVTATFQGIIADPGSAASKPASVTNAVTLEVR